MPRRSFLFATLFASAIIFGCGVKTDPVPKSTIAVDRPTSVSPVFDGETVTFTAPRSSYLLIINRSEVTDDGCTGRFTEAARLLPGESFTETPVSCGEIVYSLQNYNARLRVSSKPVIIRIDSAEPPRILSATVTLGPADAPVVTVSTNDAAAYIDVITGGEVVLRTSKPTFSPPAAGSYTLTPYTASGIRGVSTMVSVPSMMRDVPRLSDGSAIARGEDILVTWRSSTPARAFDVYLVTDAGRSRIATVSTTLYRATGELAADCPVFEIVARSNDGTSAPLRIDSCPE